MISVTDKYTLVNLDTGDVFIPDMTHVSLIATRIAPGCIPNTITHLVIKSCKEPLHINSLPTSLVMLHIKDYSHDIGVKIVPNGVVTLKLGKKYTGALSVGSIPPSVMRLYVCYKNATDYEYGCIPNTVTIMTANCDGYITRLKHGLVPNSVTCLTLTGQTNMHFIMPSNVKILATSHVKCSTTALNERYHLDDFATDNRQYNLKSDMIIEAPYVQRLNGMIPSLNNHVVSIIVRDRQQKESVIEYLNSRSIKYNSIKNKYIVYNNTRANVVTFNSHDLPFFVPDEGKIVLIIMALFMIALVALIITAIVANL